MLTVVNSIKTQWHSFLLVPVITLLVLMTVRTAYFEYQKRMDNGKAGHQIRSIDEARIRKLAYENYLAKNTITTLNKMLKSQNEKNDELREQLNRIAGGTGPSEEQEEPYPNAALQTRTIDNVSKHEIDSKAVNPNKGAGSDGIIFRVQVMSSTSRIAKNAPTFEGVKNVWEYEDNGSFKYTVGYHRDLASATTLQSRVRKMGFNGAFVVAFFNGKRIPVGEAKRILELSFLLCRKQS